MGSYQGINRCGLAATTKQGYVCEIVEYINANNVTVNFVGTDAFVKTYWKGFIDGRLENPYHPTFFGLGYKGVGDFKFIVDGKKTKACRGWIAMLQRCYGKEGLPTYRGCEVCESWYNFQNFAKWHKENYVDGWELDKDIFGKGSKLYSENTCCYVPKRLNLLVSQVLAEDETGVYVDQRNKVETYTAKYSKRYLGTYNTRKEAQEKYEDELHVVGMGKIKEFEGIVSSYILKRIRSLLELRSAKGCQDA